MLGMPSGHEGGCVQGNWNQIWVVGKNSRQEELFGTPQHGCGNWKQMSNTSYKMVSVSYAPTHARAESLWHSGGLASVKSNKSRARPYQEVCGDQHSRPRLAFLGWALTVQHQSCFTSLSCQAYEEISVLQVREENNCLWAITRMLMLFQSCSCMSLASLC